MPYVFVEVKRRKVSNALQNRGKAYEKNNAAFTSGLILLSVADRGACDLRFQGFCML